MTKLRYDPLIQLVHWLTLAAVVGVFMSGLIMEEMPRGPDKIALVGLHKSVGVVVLLLTVIRLAWRLLNPQPDSIPGAALTQMAARAMHMALYAALVAVPVIGIFMSWAHGRAVDVFGLFSLPPMIEADRALGERLGEMHEFAAWAIIVLAGVHALAAIVHQMVLKDGAIARMLPYGRPSGTA
ncbi:cytochrome B561 [Rhodovulum sp. PH10]|uniref:cytochrome b n=1 Tax=Rhodovulum sp. PH10 TaxID=1187851 RepID=UPI00027C287F|nr:cytochrome b [Rhodovulum sp. PH10]EJW13488.1 cytochrome B561 [Rhodovulum sp. PH10]